MKPCDGIVVQLHVVAVRLERKNTRRSPRLWLSAKDVVLPALKARLAAEGVSAAFRAGALVCAGTVVVRKTVDDRGAGRIVVDGPLCDEYYTVSRIVRDAFALV